MTNFINMLRDDSGASAAEYALILAIIGAGIAVASYTLGQSISGAMNKAGNCIAKQPSSAAC
ncbi:MAG: Flp family type IVb pilin [Sphingomicrobium sp.]